MGRYPQGNSRPDYRRNKFNHRGKNNPNKRGQNNSNYRQGNAQRNGKNSSGNSNARQRYSQPPRSTLREDQVGITEYVSPSTEGFTAVIKSRYSDFQVNEINLNDEVLVLNDLNVPQLEPDAPLNDDEVAEARESLKDVITDETWEKIKVLAETPKKSATPESIEIDVDDLDKDKRTQVHTLLKQLYGGKLVSSTITSDVAGAQMKFIRIAKPKGKAVEKRRKWTFPGEYVNFLVHKENMDTSEVASHIAQNLSMTASRVNYCGTKDKRGITTQKFCIKKRQPSDILSSIRQLRNVKIGNFSFSENVAKLGDLHGNRFRIALRHVTAEQSLIEQSLAQLRERGFINYYGLQRFGNCVDIPTHEIGVALVKADYKKACELILKPRSSDPPFLKAIREAWWENRDSKAAAAMFRSDRFIEKKILDGLAKYGENDFATALRKLPRNLLLLYPHAFQSLVFNRIASRRVKEYELKILPGDLVYRNKSDVDEDETQMEIAADINDDVEDNASDCDEISENAADKPAADKPAAKESVNKTEIESEFKQKVRALTEEDIASGKYTIYDVVLPLPGYDIKYPENVLDEWYKETLNEFDLTSDALNHNVKTFKMAGAYRKLVALPNNFTWEFRNYAMNDDQLIWSDWDKLKKTSDERDSLSKNVGPNRALLLDFCLPTSCYATMLLRELLKADTSSANQASLESEAKEQQKQKDHTERKSSEKAVEEKTKDDKATDEQVIVDASKPAEIKKRNRESSQSVPENDDGEPASKISCNQDKDE